MFNSKEKSRSQRLIENELERALIRLKSEEVHTEDYKKTLATVEKLEGMIEKEKSSTLSKDTLVIVGANLAGILMIIMHEHVGNFIGTKALGLIMRPR